MARNTQVCLLTTHHLLGWAISSFFCFLFFFLNSRSIFKNIFFRPGD